MSSVYTNIARKRIEQSQEASQIPSKTVEPQKSDSTLHEAKNRTVNQHEKLKDKNIITLYSSPTHFQK
jgi:hypothetical protein